MDLVIIGAGGLGREVAWLIERINAVKPTWDILGFVDDNKELHGSWIGGYPVLGGLDCLNECSGVKAICAIGAADVRKKVVEKAKTRGVSFATLVDPSAIISCRASIGEGSIICANSILTVDIRIGRHVIVNLDCTIGHDATLEDYVTLYPSVNVSGNVLIGSCVEMGTGSQIIQGRRIGYRTIIGAGSVVIRDIPEECVAVGCPATLKRKRDA